MWYKDQCPNDFNQVCVYFPLFMIMKYGEKGMQKQI